MACANMTNDVDGRNMGSIEIDNVIDDIHVYTCTCR